MLQIQMFARWVIRLSRSVTSGVRFAELLLQIEMFVSAPAPLATVVPYKQTPW